jgi:diguanylate cyclase (GGDEF)-like protein
MTVSIGVSELQPGETLSDFVARADAALYRAKSAGRNRVA